MLIGNLLLMCSLSLSSLKMEEACVLLNINALLEVKSAECIVWELLVCVFWTEIINTESSAVL
jgi:hypothetical protein